MAKSIAVVSPSFDYIDGQSLVTKEVFKIFRKKFIINEYVYKRGFSPVNYLQKLFLFVINVNQSDFVYVVISRSIIGQCRDLPYLVVSSYLRKFIFIHVHGNDFEKLLYLNVLRFLSTGRVKFICCTYEQYRFFSSLGFNVALINNFISKKRLIELDEFQKIKNSVLFLSNLIPSKGPVNTILSLKMLNRYGLKYNLKVVGNIPEKMKYEGLRTFHGWKELFESNEISILGPVYSSKELKGIFSACEIFCFPSSYHTEANPLALIEAACNGLKIVTLDRPIFRSLLSGYSCVVFINCSLPSVIADALIEVSGLAINLNEVRYMRRRYNLLSFEESLLREIE